MRLPRFQKCASMSVGIVAAAAVVWVGLGGAQEEGVPLPMPDEGTPTLAVEDTFAMPTTTLPEYLVEAPRVTLDEILRRVAQGEARRDSLMQDQAYTALIKIVYSDSKDTSKTKVGREYVTRVYKKRPDRVREVPLRSSGDEDIEIRAQADMSEQIVAFAFEARTRKDFKFEILDRSWIGGHIVYKISFRPRSGVDPLPSGIVWVDTNEFVIVREEFWFREQSPVPMFLESIENCVIERSRVDGEWWVMTRFLGRIKTTSLARLMGRMAGENLGDNIDLVLEKIDWEVNRGIPDSLFVVADS